MTDAVKKAVAIMDEAYLEYSRAKENGDETGMEAANEKAVNAAIQSGEAMTAFELHKLNGPKLSAIRSAERLAADLKKHGIDADVTVVDMTDEKGGA